MELEKTTNVTTTTTTKANKTNTTKNTTSSKKTSTSKTVSTTTSTKKTSTTTTTKSYIGVPDPNNFNYSIHHGKIDLKVNGNNEDEVRAECVMKAKLIAVKDTVDIINTNCIDVMDSENNLLGFYILVKCSSGNCNRYKN